MMCLLQNTEVPMILTAETISRKRSRAQLDATMVAATPETKKRRIVVHHSTAKKSVRFALEDNQVIVKNEDSTTAASTWYSVQEYAAFRQNMKRDVYYLASLCKTGNCQNMDRDEYSPLGLEKYCCSSGDQKQSKAMKQQRIRCVLDQQKLQRMQNRTDADTICLMAHVLSQQAVMKAIQRAARVAASKF